MKSDQTGSRTGKLLCVAHEAARRASAALSATLVAALALSAALALFAPGVRADATALAAVSNNSCLFTNQRNNGPTSASASTSCNFFTGSGNASATVDEIAGTASVTANSNDPTGSSNSVNAAVSWIVSGTITGPAGSNGTITLSDSGITASTAGPDSVAHLSLEISNPGLGTLGFVCDDTAGGCGPSFKSSLSASGSVTNGELVYLTFSMDCADIDVGTCSMSDAMTLTLSQGFTFTPDTPGFLSGGGGGGTTPEPGTLALLGCGLLSFPWLRKRLSKK